MLAVTIDSREPSSMQGLKFGKVPTVVTTLDSGDCRVMCDDGALLVIERKTPEDFLASIKDGRLFEQCTNMKAVSPYAYVIITGPIHRTPDGKVYTASRITGWSYRSYMGARLTVTELGCGIIDLTNELEYPDTIQWLAERDRGPVSAAPRNGHILSPGETCLTALPGIGLDKAQLLLQAHPSVARALEFLTRLDLGGIQGIGEKTKQNIKRALGLKENECLKVINDLTLEFLEGSNEFFPQVEIERS